MPTLTNPTDRDGLIARIERLSPDATAAWGRMTAPEMLAHCADTLRMSLGDLPCTPKDVPVARLALTKWLVFNVLPFPKNAPTAKELRARAPLAWNDEREELVALIQRTATCDDTYPWADHPLFGRMSRAQWGQLSYRHLDHHLRQFRG